MVGPGHSQKVYTAIRREQADHPHHSPPPFLLCSWQDIPRVWIEDGLIVKQAQDPPPLTHTHKPVSVTTVIPSLIFHPPCQ